MLKLTNTLTGSSTPFTPFDGSTVRMYACGPTVHDFAHIGNFRTFVFIDVLRRHLRSKGWKILHVMNITDVDDKIIQKAMQSGVDIRTYTEQFTQAFFQDADRLRIERPDLVPRATDHIPEMVSLVQELIDKGAAYREGDSIYFRISRFPEYGRLSKVEKRELLAGARVDVDEYAKEESRDFVLWKAPKTDTEPAWDTAIGRGRPGWHLECSAMAMKYLGRTLDIHCGAVDLVFPHHENEIAQSEAATGAPFVRFWIHGEHLIVEGEKMAKSKDNFFTLRDLLLRGVDPLAIRYLLVSTPYRTQLNFTFDGLHQAQKSIERIREFLFRLRGAKVSGAAGEGIGELVRAARRRFEDSLDDDLNTAQALAAVFDLIRESNIAIERGRLREEDRSALLNWFRQIDERLGIVPAEREAAEADNEIAALVADRNDARRKRDFARADQVRQLLFDRGVVIEDTREGTRWRRK